MSYIFLLEPGEESSAECFSDIPACALSNGISMPAKSCLQDSVMDACHASQSGMTCKPSTDTLGAGVSMSSAGASPAKIYRHAGAVLESTGREAVCGGTWPESFARWDRASCSWKTPQCSLLAGLDEWSETWPRWGMMLHGECSELMPWAYLITEPGCGWLPTPLASDTRDRGDVGMPSIQRRYAIGKQVSLSALFKGAQCPTCAEVIMGWPENWSATNVSATDKFRQWQHSHSSSFPLVLANNP